MKRRAGHGRGEGWLIAAGIACAALLCLFMWMEGRPRELRVGRISEVSVEAMATPEPGPLDINSAAAEELSALPGIGVELAERIVEYRAVNGEFQSVEDLDGVPGIGAGKIEAIRSLVFCG